VINLLPTIVKKSWRDLSRRKARTIFTIITIALGIGGLGMFAVPPLMDQAMSHELETSNMYDVQVTVNDVNISSTHFQELLQIYNVKAVETRAIHYGRIYIGERRNDALFVGVDDFSNQQVDRISKKSGEFPGPGELLSDKGNRINNVHSSEIGSEVRVINSSGSEEKLKISGEARNIVYTTRTGEGIAVYYGSIQTVRGLGNLSGYNSISFDLVDTDKEVVEATIVDIRTYLSTNTSVVAFKNLPQIRAEGEWPGKEGFENTGQMFYMLTYLILFCSLFLISNTMHTIISEQRKEIAQMKTIGASRTQVIRSYLTTSGIMGGIGSIIGALFGIGLVYFMLTWLSTIFGADPVSVVHVPTILISIGVGIVITLIASLPALWGALRVTVLDGLQDTGISSNYGTSTIDKILMKASALPTPMQMGMRNIARKKKRSISTILQVALAVGTFLGLIAIGYSMNVFIDKEFENIDYDIAAIGQAESGTPINESLRTELEKIEGIERVEPFIYTQLKIEDRDVIAYGYNHNTSMYRFEKSIHKGRWFTETEQESNAQVIVLGKSLGRKEGIEISDKISVNTATGSFEFEVIGIDISQENAGMIAFVPLSAIQNILLWNDTVSGFLFITDSNDHDHIDTAATDIEDAMLDRGIVVNNRVAYVWENMFRRGNNEVSNMLNIVGGVIVLITLIGLMSTITMSILERTKEIGMLRCIGATSRKVRLMFNTEGITTAVAGWLVGIPLGYGIGLYINNIFYDLMGVEMTLFYPVNNILISLAVVIIMTLLVMQGPLWRATHIKPGDALRYQ